MRTGRVQATYVPTITGHTVIRPNSYRPHRSQRLQATYISTGPGPRAGAGRAGRAPQRQLSSCRHWQASAPGPKGSDLVQVKPDWVRSRSPSPASDSRLGCAQRPLPGPANAALARGVVRHRHLAAACVKASQCAAALKGRAPSARYRSPARPPAPWRVSHSESRVHTSSGAHVCPWPGSGWRHPSPTAGRDRPRTGARVGTTVP